MQKFSRETREISDKLAACLRTQRKKKNSQSTLKILTGRILTKVVESRIESRRRRSALKLCARSKGAFTPGLGSRNEVS